MTDSHADLLRAKLADPDWTPSGDGERLALAVLAGEVGAAAALADWVRERHGDRVPLPDFAELFVRLYRPAATAIRAAGIAGWAELCSKTADELRRLPGFGPKALGSVRSKLHGFGLRLKGDPSDDDLRALAEELRGQKKRLEERMIYAARVLGGEYGLPQEWR